VIEHWGEPSLHWEYTTVRQGQPIGEEHLNELGKEGWRLVTVTVAGEGPLGLLWVAYLMRAVQA
jgi:hypothetical protein